MDLLASIKGIKYHPFLCRKLEVFDFNMLEKALNSYSSFILKVDNENKIAVSWWVSAKRTRSYPYARVYDTLNFMGKKITIIPIIKDEGKDGDRDFLQWDTISLMSLLGVYVIIAYYNYAEKSKKYKNKITNQHFDVNYIKKKINEIILYQSDALHWNLYHANEISIIGKKALKSYEKISQELKVKMHSKKSAEKRIAKLAKSKDEFINLSRSLAKKAQIRESFTIQPKEKLKGKKARITIQNYLGGYYYFTVDEFEIVNNTILIIESKHSRTNSLPSLEDIKDGLLKMILFTNLDDIKLNGMKFNSIAALKLTVENHFDENKLTSNQKEILKLLRKEAEVNNFKIILE